MLQPRRKKIRELAWLLLAGFCLQQVACDIGSDGIGSGRVRAERVGRDENDANTVLLLDNSGRNGRYLATAVPVVTSTARTFVQEGTTTEYATHVIGTRLDKGKLYASVVGTSSRVYYDTHLPRLSIDNQILPTNPRSAIKPTAHLVYPAKDTRVPYGSSSGLVYQTAVKGDPLFNKSLKTIPDLIPLSKQHQPIGSEDANDGVVRFSSQSSSSKHVERKHKYADEQDNFLAPNADPFKKRNVDAAENSPLVNPAQVVRPVLGLPTFTIKHDFAPSGFSADIEEEETTEGKKIKDLLSLRGGKALYRNGVKTDSRKLDTVTYKGFADFTTTVGDTVIIFMPNTAPMESSKVTSSPVQTPPTEEPNKIVTKMKTFYSVTPGMQTKTVSGHSLSMQTSLPTHLILPESGTRHMKAFPPAGPVHVVTVDLNSASSISPLDSDIKPSVVAAEPALIEPSVEEVITESPAVIGSTTSFLPTATEPLATFATTRTQILAAADQKQPLGLVKVLGGTRAYDDTTTLFTSLFYGTIVDGTYTQVIHSTSSTFNTAPTTAVAEQPSSTTEGTTEGTTDETTLNVDEAISTTPNESTTPSTEDSSDDRVKTGRKIKTRPVDQIIAYNNDNSSNDKQKVSPSEIKPKTSSTDNYLTRIVPTTAYKTFTYLTTFFIPDGDKTTTSVRSREVTSSEVSLVTKVINANVVQPSKLATTAASSLPEKLTTTTSTTTEELPSTTEKEATTEDAKPTTELPAETEKSTDFVSEAMETTTDGAEQLTDITTDAGIVLSEQVVTTESEEITVTTPTPTTPSTEDDEEEIDLIFKTLYTTYTYLTTFFQESTTSVSSREVVVTNIVTSTLDTKLLLQSSPVAGLFERSESLLSTEVMPTSVGVGRPTTQHFPSIDAIDDSYGEEASNQQSGVESPDLQSSSEADSATKTFFTTYTYFTTIFVDGETTISSRTEVYTNIVTPSIVATPTTDDIRVTPTIAVDYMSDEESAVDDIEGSDDVEYLQSSHVRTPVLISTPHYAYSSTISRNRPSSGVRSSPNVQSSLPAREKDDNDITVKSTPKFDDRYATISRPQNDVASAAAFEGTTRKSPVTLEDEKTENEDLSTVTQEPTTVKDAIDVRGSFDQDSSASSVTLPTEADRDGPKIQVRLDTFVPGEDIDASPVTNEPMVVKTMAMVTDITSSSSGGNEILDDQISSESNTEEIEPSPILLLQTSFTTFTYFTTVYKGSTSSEVISRLETVTNVVTETLSPTSSSVIEEDSTLPITYFTTFTYWTTLYRDGNTVVTSREETVSNIITPTVTLPPVLITATPGIETTTAEIEPTKSEPTTYYTTYTYFTTSYIGNSTVLNSRLETITNIVNETDDQTGRAIGTSVPDQLIVDQITKTEPATLPTGLLSTIATSQVEDGTTTLFSTDVYGTYIDGLYAKILESSTQIVTDGGLPSDSVQVQPTGVVSLNEGSIVDANGISTTYFTTKAIGTYIEQLYAEVLESTSSIKVDEEKKTLLASELDDDKQLKTGLVRLIEGSIVKDDITTFYESKVVGTVIDGRYAQIIESTSSFKIGMKTKLPQGVIVPTSAITLDQAITGTSSHGTSPSSTVLESSLGDAGGEDGENEDEDEEDDEEDDDDSDGAKKSKKSRLTFSTRKRTFTPVIRPFASRNRPTFNPRRKTANASSATTITRTTLTPTITATPAAKTTEGRGRFASNRRQSSSLNEIGVRPSSSSSRRFSRVRGSTPALGVASTLSPTVGRGRSTTRVFPTATASAPGSSRRPGFFRSSSTRGGVSDFSLKSTSGGASSSRLNLRLRPTSSGFGRGASSVYATPSSAEPSNPEDNVVTTSVTEETPNNTEEEQESPTQPISTTTESPRRSNPLLRFRRPPTLRTPSSTSRPSTTPSPRKSPLRRTSDTNNNRVTTTTSTTTAKPVASFNSRFKNLNNNRPRPSNSLFPRRGLLKKPEEEVKEAPKEIEKEEDELLNDEAEEEIADNDYEGSEVAEVEETKTEATFRKSKALSSPQIRPFVGFQRRRSKRQTSEYGTRRDTSSRTANYNQRFRRPVSRTPAQVQERYDYVDEEPATEAPRTKTTSRFTPRSRPSQPTQQKIRSTTASSNAGRSQFTLREKDTTPRTNFRRPTPAPRRRPPSAKETSSRQTPNSPRLRPQPNSQADSTQYSRLSGRRGYSSSNTNSRRPQSRSRTRGDVADSYTFSQSSFDGTITVTHRVPTEVTIPIVNGKVTEYRNVITASPSTEILGPHQYTTTSGKDGNTVLLLTSEVTGTLAGGVTEVTQYILHETPTTSVTFTPTVIRGRKTSFSHIVPSTVYDVERLVSTIQPQLSPNAPLANILLSQLLLGNLNLAQPNINPLLGLNTAMTPATPVTEFKTHATTYVTTVTKGSSTILPLTFRGKEILTTIVDTTLETITATEFITDTIVTTPTAAAAPNQQQLNSLLLPALLQAQLLQSQNQQATQSPLISIQQLQDAKAEEILAIESISRGSQKRRKQEEDRQVRGSEKEYDDDDLVILEEEPVIPRFKPSRKKPSRSQIADKKPPDPPNPPSTSVITLYVSGRRPGEFSTVLSTVVVDDDNSATIKKREAEFAAPDLFSVDSSKSPDLERYFPNDLEDTLLFSLNDIAIESSKTETQSLESIVGDVSKYNIADRFSPTTNSNPSTETDVIEKSATTSDKATGHFLSKGPAELAPLKRKVVKVSNRGQAKSNYEYENSQALTSPNDYAHLMRAKREVDDEDNSTSRPVTGRRRVRVRVPIARRVSDDRSYKDQSISEAQRPDKLAIAQDLRLDEQEFGVRNVKVIRTGNKEQHSDDDRDHHKKRVVIRRRKPVDNLLDDRKLSSDHEQHLEPQKLPVPFEHELAYQSSSQSIMPSHRRQITITKKRPIFATSSVAPSSTHRRRLIVTKKRLVSSPEEIAPTHSMKTLYSYMYSVMNDTDPKEPNNVVKVSQVFMIGSIPEEIQLKKSESSADNNESVEATTETSEEVTSPDIIFLIEPSQTIESSFSDSQNSNSVESTQLLEENGFVASTNADLIASVSHEMEKEANKTNNVTEKDTKLQEDVSSVTDSSSNEESTTLDGPRFIRPTRFSITRKPSRTKASFPGGRRKTSEHHTTTSATPSETTAATRNSYRSTSHKYNPNRLSTRQPEVNPTPSLNSFKQSSKSFRPSKSKSYGKSQLSSTIAVEPDIKKTEDNLEDTTNAGAHLTDQKLNLDETNIEITPSTPTDQSDPQSYLTRLVTRTRLRTYTYIVTRVSGTEEVVTSSTEVKPHITTTTLTQVAHDHDVQVTARDDRVLNMAEARYNLATKVMSNGVEVIVAGDRSTLPGEPEILRVLTPSQTRPTTLPASTLTDHMMMFLPQKPSESNEFVTNTYMTTYAYNSEELVVSNTVTEERAPAAADLTKLVSLSTSPVLATGVFHTAYTYYNTLVDEDQPLVVSSTELIDNTVTAPIDQLTQTELKETNTYLNPMEFSKTVTEGGEVQVLSTSNVLTQKIVTNIESQTLTALPPTGATTDVVKTYFVTYTYLNTYLEDGSTVVSSDVSISTDIVTEKFYINPKRTNVPTKSVADAVNQTKPVKLFATKTYLTTFTYFTTLLQEDADQKTSTLVSSHTSVVQNIVTESLFQETFGNQVQDETMKITSVGNLAPTKTMHGAEMTSTQGLSSSMEDDSDDFNTNSIVTGSTIVFFDEHDQIDSESPQSATPALESAINSAQTTILNGQLSESQGAVSPQALTSQSIQQDIPRPQGVNTFETSILAASTVTSSGNTLLPGDEVIMLTQANGNISMIPVSDPTNKKPNGGTFGPGGNEIQVSDLLSLGSLGINGLNALGPVINAMAGLIQSNLHDNNRRNDTATSAKPGLSYLDGNGNPRPVFVAHGDRTTPRSPIYIPVGGLAEDADTAESVNQESWSDTHGRHPSADNSVALGRPTHESPLLSDGIAISPGQVITANSDVIVGKPGLLGPRPPKIHSEKEIPAGMRPPPPPRPKRPANDQYFGPPPALDQVGHQSINSHSGSPPPPPKREHTPSHGPTRNHVGGSSGHQPIREQPVRNYNGGPPNRDHQQNQSPIRNQFPGHAPSRNNPNIESDLNPPPITNNLASFHTEKDIPLYTPAIGADIIVHPPILNENHYIITNNPLSQEFGQFPVSSGVQAVYGGQPQPNDIILGKMPTGSHVLDSSAGQPLLVNIQPSQVANVIIKDGSSSATPFGDNEEYIQHAQSHGSQNRPNFGSDDIIDGDDQHHYVVPVGSVHQTRMDPPVADLAVSGHEHQPGNIEISPLGINVDISPGQGINVDVSSNHGHGGQASGQLHGNEHISPSGIVLDEPLNNRPLLNEISFGKPGSTNSRPEGPQDLPRRPQRPLATNGLSRPRFPPINYRPGPNNKHHPTNNNQLLQDKNHGGHQIPHGSNAPHGSNGPHGNNQGSGEQTIHNYPKSPTEFMVPPPAPTKQFTNTPNVIPLKAILSQENADSNKDHSFPDDNEGDYDSLELDGGEVVQASNSRPLTVGQSSQNATTRRPMSKPTVNTEMPEVFMRPPQLPVSNINVHQVFEKRPTRPGNNAGSFDVVVQPQGNFGRPQVFDEKPFEEKSTVPNFDERQEAHNQGTQGGRVPTFAPAGRPHLEESLKKPFINIKRPSPSFEKPTISTSFDQESQGNTPRPFVNRPAPPSQSDIDRESVVGLSPPPEPQHPPVVKIGGQRRPTVPSYRNHTRPGSPYKFEVPIPSNGNGNKQTTRSPLQEILTLSETNFQQNQKQGSTTQNPIRPDKKPVHVDFGKTKPVAIQPPSKSKPIATPNIYADRDRGSISTSHIFKTSVLKPRPSATEASSPLQTVVIVGKPIQSNPPSVPFSIQQPAQWDGQVVSSETAYRDHVIQPTPTTNYVRNTAPSSRPALTSSKTPFGNHFTRPSNVLAPTRVAGIGGFGNIFGGGKESSFKTKQQVDIPTRYITHTKTLTVTLTETTVVSSEGHRPSTRTVVVTKTQTTTQVDTVTQIHTLVKPTEIRATSTVTTTVSASQYPPGSPFDPANYPQFPVKIAPLDKTNKDAEGTEKDLEKPEKKGLKKGPNILPEENDTFFVVVNDKKFSSVSVSTSNKDKPAVSVDVTEEEVASRDETDSNAVNQAVLLEGVLVAAPPPRHGSPSSARPATACRPDCSAARNELCQRVNGNMRCVCRPGFARMFPDRPCKPTYTYTLRLDLDHHGKEPLKFDPVLREPTSGKFRSLAEASREGLDRLVMQSDLRDIYHGVAVHGFQPSPKKDGVQVSFYVQLSDNADETRLKDVFKKSLRTSNYSLGGTDMYADKERLQYLFAEDFDECASTRFHDCSEHSHCFNLRGTYTCSCKEGFADLSENRLFPGRVCSAELIGCDKCHYHGTCYSRGDDQLMCECFQWYSGENCQVNLKVLLIALVTIGALLLALLLVCAVLTCLKRNRSRKPGNNAPGFLRYRGPPRTLDKRAMIVDSSSEGSVDNGPVTFLAPTHQPSSFLGNKSVLKGARRISEPHPSGTMISMGYADQRDRSLTVMIPRAKYRSVPPTSPHLTMSTFGVEENKKAIVQEQKLLGYLEHGVQETRTMNNPRRKQSNGTNHSSESSTPKKMPSARKASNGALVSAGFEVSAMVGCKEGSDNDLLTAQESMNQHFPPIRSNERTVSEVRSCNETTIQPPTKSFHGPSQYGSKPSSRNRDEAHTMAERDLGSTLLMPQTHLYRPDRGSDISNFDSL